MQVLFAETYPVVWMAVALVLILASGAAMIAARRFKTQVQTGGGTTTGAYYLKITLFMIFILACLFGGLFLLTSYR